MDRIINSYDQSRQTVIIVMMFIYSTSSGIITLCLGRDIKTICISTYQLEDNLNLFTMLKSQDELCSSLSSTREEFFVLSHETIRGFSCIQAALASLRTASMAVIAHKRSAYSDLSKVKACMQAGGGERDRTDDLLNANQMLSQLSYTPIIW